MKNSIRRITRKASQVLILFMLFYSTYALAQDSTHTSFKRKKILAGGISDIGYSFSYSSFYSKQNAFSIAVGYTKGSNFTGIFGISFKDPNWCYNKFSIQTGIKLYNRLDMYFSPTIALSYGFYDNLLFTEYDGKKNNDAKISRDKTSFGFVAKFGFTEYFKRINFDFYLGVGYRISKVKEELYDPNHTPINIYKSTYSKGEPTVHLGLQIGFYLNRRE